MRKAVRILQKISYTLVGFIVLVLVLIGLSRLTTPSAVQREVVVLMQRDELPHGPDAFGLLWTLHRDVPFDEIDAVVQADVAQVAEWTQAWEPGEMPGGGTRWRRDDYPHLSMTAEDRDRFCRTDNETTCLTQVRAAPEATSEAVARNARLLERVQRLRDAEVLRFAMPPHLMAPTPSFQDGVLPMTAHVLAFVQGDEEYAVAEVCRDFAAWRRLALNTDMLIGTMVGIAYAGRGYGPLLAEMLAEWPVDRPLPAACDAALAPTTGDELLLCHAVRGEFRLQETLSEQFMVLMQNESWAHGMLAVLFHDPESSVALAAEQLAPYCTADRPGRPDHDWAKSRSEQLLRWVCVGNPIGCVLTGAAGGYLYGAYADRLLDFDARIRQLRTLAWMRTQAASGARADALIERLPDDLRNDAQTVELTPDGRRLRVTLIDDSRGEWAEIPLPPALWAGVGQRVDGPETQ